MPSTSHSLLNYLRVVVGAWRDDPRDDATLLARFAEGGDEAAFRALVCRHGPLVWRTCRRMLGDTPDAEDAFQTAFLTLARKAGQLRREPLAGWLHRVTRQAAMDVEAGARRRRGLEQRLRAVKRPEAEGGGESRAELYAALDEELAGLPERLRVPLLLHYLEGKTQIEVARLLGCTRNMVQYRLARAEAALRKRLERRGLAVSVGSIAVLLGSTAGVPAVPALLIGNTVRAALRSFSFPPPLESFKITDLAEGVLKTVLVTKMKLVAMLLGVMLCLAGGGLLVYQALAGNIAEPSPPAAEKKGETEAPCQPEVAAQVDCFGDPLPAGALARMGTTRLYYRGDRVVPKALAFSPDGKTLATHIDGMTVCLWDAATGKEIRRLTTEADRERNWLPPLVSLGFSPNGKTLIAVNWKQTVCLWDVATGKFLRKQEYQGPKRRNMQCPTIAFLPNGKMLGCGGFLKSREEGMRAYVWDLASGKEICQMDEPMRKRDLLAVKAFSPDGKLIATALAVRRIKEKDEKKTIISLWDVATGREIRQLTHKDDGVNAVAFSPDGKTLASADPKKICVWEVATGKKIHRLEVEGGMWFHGPLTYSPDGKTLLGGMEGRLWDVATGKEIRSFGCKDGKVAIFSPDGKVLAMGDQVGAIRLWEVATGKEIGPRKGYRGPIQSVAYSPDSKTLASMNGGIGDQTVRLWEVATGKEMRPLVQHTTFGSGCIAYSPDGKMLVSMDDVLHLWETATGKEIRQLKGEIPMTVDSPRSVTFSPNGKKLAALLGGDQLVHLWEVATGKQIYTLATGFTIDDNVESWSIAFSPDGRLLAAPGKDGMVSLWEVATGQRIGQLKPKKPVEEGVELFVRFLAFSPDGRMLATSSKDDDKIHLWEMASGKEIRQLDGLKNCREGYTLAFSPDSRMSATAAQGTNGNGYFDPKVHLWEVASGKEIGQLSGHQSFVRTLAFSPDGKTLASGSDDLTCLVWDLISVGRLILPPRALSQEQLEATWADLAKDPAKAYAAIEALRVAPAQAVPLLQARLRPVAPVADPQQLKRWIADLDANSFTVRDKAQREIEKLGEPAAPALRQALKGQPAVEVRRRLKDLLAGLEPQLFGGSLQRMRELRAVQTLEFIGTAEARRLLQALAQGVAGARLTVEAQAALARLAKRPPARP